MRLVQISLSFILVLLLTSVAFGSPRDFRAYLVPSEIEFQLIDPLGNVTGYDPSTRNILNNIPHTKYLLDAEDTPERPPTKYEKVHLINSTLISDTVTVTPGTYKVRLFGSAVSEKFTFIFKVYYHGLRGPRGVTELKSIIYPNVTWTYEFAMPASPTATGEMMLTKVASSNDLITDINAANGVGHLDTPGTYQSLLAKAENAKAKLDAGQPVPAKNILNAFINEITAQKGQQIDANAADILIEDAQYIISHN